MIEGRYTELPRVSPETGLDEVARLLVETGSYVTLVSADNGEPVGWVECLDLLKAFLENGPEKELKARDIARPIEVVDHLNVGGSWKELHEWYHKRGKQIPYFISPDGKLGGMLSLQHVVNEIVGSHFQEQERRRGAEALYTYLLEQLPLGIAILTGEGEVRQANKLAQRILANGVVDQRSLLERGLQEGPRVFKDKDGTYFRAWSMDIDISGEKGALVAFVDVTTEYRLMEKVRQAQEEAELALATMLPDQRIERRLKEIIEYQDEYNEDTGRIKITGIIRDGVYRHVINMLRLIAEATRQGLMELPGIDKNTLVMAAVFHDIAKVQPVLQIGDEVDPKQVFEPGYLHAFRGAAMAKGIYRMSDEICQIIKYHHTAEQDLPGEFPVHLLPMYRFFRLVDGLSAGITRRGARVTMRLVGTTVHVREESSFPAHNQDMQVDLYSGKVVVSPS